MEETRFIEMRKERVSVVQRAKMVREGTNRESTERWMQWKGLAPGEKGGCRDN